MNNQMILNISVVNISIYFFTKVPMARLLKLLHFIWEDTGSISTMNHSRAWSNMIADTASELSAQAVSSI